MSEGRLIVKDSRTSREYEVPIHRNGVFANAFKRIRGPATTKKLGGAEESADGLHVFDPGLQNTAVVETSTSFA